MNWPNTTRTASAIIAALISFLPPLQAQTDSQPKSSRNLGLEKLLEKTPEEIGKTDIAEMNLLCAAGLPGKENVDIPASLAVLDEWAKLAQKEIERNYHRFRDNPAEYDNSEGLYKMVVMILTLQQDFKVRYNPTMMGPFANRTDVSEEEKAADLADESYFKNSHDCFLSGVLADERMGTCATMPVLYIAVGRRLGFPLKLVCSKGHSFVRWDGKGERFNIEGTGTGVDSLPDEYYRKWPLTISQDEVDSGQFLKSLTPTEELAVFLDTRAICLRANNRYSEALLAAAHAFRLQPKNIGSQISMAKTAEVVTAEVVPETPSPEQYIDPGTAPTDPEAIMRLNRENAERLPQPLPGAPSNLPRQSPIRNPASPPRQPIP